MFGRCIGRPLDLGPLEDALENLQGFSLWLNFSHLAKNVFKRAKVYVLLGFQ
jgi:hypothetical protein